MRRRIFVTLGMVFLVNLIACSSRIKLQFQQPVHRVIFPGILIQIAPCEGADEAGMLCNFLTGMIEQADYFELFDRNKFAMALEQNQLTYETIKQADSMVQIGTLLNVNGIIFSELKSLEILPDEQGVEKVEKIVWTGEYERDQHGEIIEEMTETGETTKKKKFKLQTVDQHYRIRRAKIEASFQLIDLQKGFSIIARELSDSLVSEKIIKEENQKAPTEDEIKNTITRIIVQKFFSQIAPKAITVKRVIESGSAPVDSGAVYAKTGQWISARKYWERAQRIHPYDARIQYNLGLACEAMGEYKSAEVLYKKASLLNPKKKLYQKAVENLRKVWQEE